MVIELHHARLRKSARRLLSETVDISIAPSLLEEIAPKVVNAMMWYLSFVAVLFAFTLLPEVEKRLLDAYFPLDCPWDDNFNPFTEMLMKEFPRQYMDTWEALDVSLEAYGAEAMPGDNNMLFILYTNPDEQLSADCLAERSATMLRDYLNAPVYTILDIRLLLEVTTESKELVDSIRKALKNITDNHVVIIRGFEKLSDAIASELMEYIMKSDPEKSLFYIVEVYVEKGNEGRKGVVSLEMYPSMDEVDKDPVMEVFQIPEPIYEAKNFLDSHIMVTTESTEDLRQSCPNLINI